MTRSSNTFHLYIFQYDALDRVTQQRQNVQGLTSQVTFTSQFDSAGNRRFLSAAIGTINGEGGTADFKNKYVYDGLNRLASLIQQGNGGHAVANKRVDFTHDLTGQLDTIRRYTSIDGTSAPVAVSDFNWDNTGRLKDLQHWTGSTPGSGALLAGYGYTWNQRHELTALDFLPDGTNSPFDYTAEDVSSYDYDPHGQLTNATYTTQTNESYQYDENGNRTNGGFVPGVNNRLITDGVYNYTYDNEGNITRRTRINGTDLDGTKVREFTWDNRNRLIKVTSKNTANGEINRVEYGYDAEDYLIRRQVFLSGSTTPSEQQVFLYDNGQIVLEFDKPAGGSLATADLANRYLWGRAVDQLLADEDINSLTDAVQNQVKWPLTDHLGTPRDWIDSSGALLDHAEYDAFGRRLDADAIDAAFEWTARYRDPLTGLQYNNARWYNPAIQRWMSEDPIGFAGGDSNLSRYVGNMPTIYVDPSGLSWLGKFRKLIDEGGHLFGRKVRNWQFRNKLVNLTDLENLTRVSRETIDRLRKNYGDEFWVQFDDCAQPNLLPWSQTPAPVKVSELTGDAAADGRKAWAQLKKDDPELYKRLDAKREELRFHHSGTDEMILIDKDLHEAFQHTGPAAVLRNTSSSLLFGLLAPGLSEIHQDIKENPQCAEDISNWDVIQTGVLDALRWFDPFFEDIWKAGGPNQIMIDKVRRDHELLMKAREEGIFINPPGPKY